MPRRPADPSGASRQAAIRLSPAHLAKLDRLAARRHLTRSQFVARLLDRITEEPPPPPLDLGPDHARPPPTEARTKVDAAAARARQRRQAAEEACQHWRTSRRDGERRCLDCGILLE